MGDAAGGSFRLVYKDGAQTDEYENKGSDDGQISPTQLRNESRELSFMGLFGHFSSNLFRFLVPAPDEQVGHGDERVDEKHADDPGDAAVGRDFAKREHIYQHPDFEGEDEPQTEHYQEKGRGAERVGVDEILVKEEMIIHIGTPNTL